MKQNGLFYEGVRHSHLMTSSGFNSCHQRTDMLPAGNERVTENVAS